MKYVTVKKNQDRRVQAGHPWVFSNEIAELSEPAEIGEEVAVQTHQKRFLGRGFYHPHSLIAVRIITRVDEAIDQRFFVDKLKRAWSYRQQLYPQHHSYRVFFGESDGISGLVVDKFDDLLVVQLFSAGVERRKELLKGALAEVFAPRAIVARNDFSARAQEGLEQRKELWLGQAPSEHPIEQDGISFLVDPWNGQKTGFFFDQRDNRAALQEYTRGKRVLDCFTYSGGFGLYAAKAGAQSVLAVDSAADALSVTEQNFQKNGLGQCCTVRKADVFDFLKESGEKYDVVVLDPPALVKRKTTLREGLKGYQNLNLRALEKLVSGGILVTCSCSYHVTEEAFREQLLEAARKSGRELHLLESRTQSRDHPILLAMRETKYLKCAFLRVS
jgi:23S rRNA (cytosine1962-C5)-methyltransferase